MVLLRKAALDSLHVFSVIVLSRIVTVGVIGACMLATRRRIWVRQPGVWPYLILLGLLNLLLNWLANQGMQWSTAAVASVLFKTDVLFTILLGWVLLGERVSPAHVPMIAAALGGCAIVILLGGQKAEAQGTHRLAGNLLCVAFGLVLTINAILIRAKLSGLGKMQLAFWVSFLGLAFCSAVWPAAVSVPGECATIARQPGVIVLLAGAGVAAAVTFVAYYQAIWHLPVWVVRVVLLLSPAFALLGALWFLDEPVTRMQVLGMALLLGGAASAVVSGRRRPQPTPGPGRPRATQ